MGEFGKDCSDCGRKCRKPKDSAALFVCYAFWECTKWETGEGISFLRGFCPFPPRRFSRAPLPTSRDATVALCQSGRLLFRAKRPVPSRPSQHSKTKPQGNVLSCGHETCSASSCFVLQALFFSRLRVTVVHPKMFPMFRPHISFQLS